MNRFIPTGVGNARYQLFFHLKKPVHPHGRGERLYLAVLNASLGGSSPRAWGTPIVNIWSEFRERLIPTGVGNATPH